MSQDYESQLLKLLDNDEIVIIAPYGLDDLFQMVLRRNPRRVTEETFLKRALEGEQTIDEQ